MKIKSFSAGCFLAFFSLAYAQNNNPMKMIQTFTIGGDDSSWDYLSLNPQNDQLYVSHGNRVNVINKTTGSSIAEIQETNGVHGIAFIPNTTKGYISCGKLDKVKVFNTQDRKSVV